MNPILFLALRSLKGRHGFSHSFFSFLISLTVITVGISAIIVVTGVMSGFHEEFLKRLLAFKPHLYLTSPQAIPYPQKWIMELRNLKEIKEVSPVIWGEGILKTLSGERARGVIVKGVWGEGKGVILGKELASNLGVRPGEEVFLVTSSLSGEVLKINGTLTTGIYQLDSSLVILPLSLAQKVFKMKGLISGVEVKLFHPSRVEKVKEEIKTLLPPFYYARTWKEMDAVFFSALKLEKITMFTILSILFFVATFSISSSLIVKVTERKREIGILRTIGFTPQEIKKIFLTEGLFIALTGWVGGSLLAITMELIIKVFKPVTLPQAIYSLSYLPVKIEPGMYLLMLCFSVITTLLATVFPAIKASRLDVSEIIRYE